MCKVRGFRHTRCGHTAHKCLSTCRGTYGSPGDSRRPRCSASCPTLTVRFDKSCHDCQYQAFCEDWQERIEEVRERRDAFCSLLQDMECGTEDDIWCSEADDGLSFGDLAGPDDRPCTVDDSRPVEKCSGDCGGWCSDPKCPRKTKRQQKEREPEIERHWLDPASLRNERARLNSELSQIQSEFESLLWSEWSQMSTGGRSFDKPRRRRTQPKIDGHSPLKEVMSLDDIKTPPKPFAFFHPDSDDSSIDDLSLSPSDSPTSDAASITSTLTNTSVTTPRDSPVTSPNGSPPSEQTKRRLWTEWSDRADGTCPLTNLAFRSSGTQQLLRPSSHSRSQSWPAGEKQETALAFHKQEPLMLSDEWMRNLQELTMSECAVHAQSRGEVGDPVEDMLPDWDT